MQKKLNIYNKFLSSLDIFKQRLFIIIYLAGHQGTSSLAAIFERPWLAPTLRTLGLPYNRALVHSLNLTS